jgi:hypothetical protein
MVILYTHFFLSKGPQKFAQIEIFGLKIDHLATLEEMCKKEIWQKKKRVSEQQYTANNVLIRA